MSDTIATPPVRILIVSTELGMGGAERCATHIACGLNRQHFRTQVVSLAPAPEPPRDGLLKRMQHEKIPVSFFDCTRSWHVLSAVRKFRKFVDSWQPDVVLSFLWHANLVSAWGLRGSNIPSVQSLRVIEQGHMRRRLQGWAGHRAAKVICVSRGVESFARTELGLPEDRLQVIPNGIAAEMVAKKIAEPAIDRPQRILSVGRLVEQKGFDRLIHWFAKVAQENKNCELVVVGDGPERPRLARQIKRLGLADRIQFPGWQADLKPWWESADLYVLSSRWEGMPNTLIEAMAYGLPVLATDVEGVGDLLRGSLSQQIFPLNDDLAAVAKLLNLISNQGLRASLGAENAKSVVANYSLESMLGRYEAMLLDVANREANGC